MKRFSCLFAAAAMIFAASCQKEQFASEGDYANVSFSAELPGAVTKAVADGTTANTLYYEVYTVDADGKSQTLVYDDTAEVSGKTATVSVRLIKNKPYNVYFWAQYEADGYTSPYTVDDLQNVEVSYDGAIANDEGRDAFYKVLKSVTYSGNNAETVYLNRAFAQVNIATSDLEEVLRQGSRPQTSSLEISNLATSFNTFTGEGTGSEDAVFATFHIPGLNSSNRDNYTAANVQDLQNVGAEKKSYDYLATAYVLVPAAEGLTSISSVKATINYAADNSVTVLAPEATIQKNWRTNIFGNLLTSSIEYNIEVDQEFENDHTADINQAALLVNLLAAGGTVTLNEDIELNESLTIAEGVSAVLDLNGNTLKVTTAEDGTVTDIKNYGTLTVKGGEIVAENAELSRRCIYNYGEMTIDGTKFVQTYNEKGAAINNEGKMVIKNADVTANYYAIWNSGADSELTIEDGRFVSINTSKENPCYNINNNKGAKLTINGGYFEGTHGVVSSVSGATAILNGGEYVCTGEYSGNSDWALYAADNGSTIYYNEDACTISNDNNPKGISTTENGGLVKAMVKSSSSSDLSSVEDNSYVVLEAGTYNVSDATIKGDNITIAGDENVKINAASSANIGLSGSMTFEGVTIVGNNSGQYNGFQTKNGGTLTFNNVTFEGTHTIYSNSVFNNCTFNLPSECYIWTAWGPSEVTYEGCTFNTAGKALLVYHENGTCTVNVNNCTFKASAGDKAGAIANQNCAAIEIDNSGKGVGTDSACHFTINTSGNTFDDNFSGEWRIKTFDPTGSVTVNGVSYSSIALDGKAMTIDENKYVTVVE